MKGHRPQKEEDVADDPLPHLETFATAAELSSFTAAGKALGMTQAAVSQRIAALEAELGVPLFRREGGKVSLTDAGRTLHGYARRILDLSREARQEVTGRAEPLTGELALAASSVPGEHLLPALLEEFRRRHPHVRVRATEADSDAVLTQVERGEAHVGLVGKKGDSPYLEHRCFACDRLALVVPTDHPLARRESLPLSELRGLPLVLREAGSGSRWCLERAMEKAVGSVADLQVALEMGSNEAIKEAVLRGMGLAVLSTHAVAREVESGLLRTLPVAGLALEREMFAVWDRRRALPAPAQLFLDLLEPCGAAGS
jgi:DNA-binding transcriptional LysR family regulator